MVEFLDKLKRRKKPRETTWSYTQGELEGMKQEAVARAIKDMFGRGTILFLPRVFCSLLATGDEYEVLEFQKVLTHMGFSVGEGTGSIQNRITFSPTESELAGSVTKFNPEKHVPYFEGQFITGDESASELEENPGSVIKKRLVKPGDKVVVISPMIAHPRVKKRALLYPKVMHPDDYAGLIERRQKRIAEEKIK